MNLPVECSCKLNVDVGACVKLLGADDLALQVPVTGDVVAGHCGEVALAETVRPHISCVRN